MRSVLNWKICTNAVDLWGQGLVSKKDRIGKGGSYRYQHQDTYTRFRRLILGNIIQFLLPAAFLRSQLRHHAGIGMKI
jgi:hypothetical protein